MKYSFAPNGRYSVTKRVVANYVVAETTSVSSVDVGRPMPSAVVHLFLVHPTSFLPQLPIPPTYPQDPSQSSLLGVVTLHETNFCLSGS